MKTLMIALVLLASAGCNQGVSSSMAQSQDNTSPDQDDVMHEDLELTGMPEAPKSLFVLKLKSVPLPNGTTDRLKFSGIFSVDGIPHRILSYQLERAGSEAVSPVALEAFQEKKFSDQIFMIAEGNDLEKIKADLESWNLTVWYLFEGEAVPVQFSETDVSNDHRAVLQLQISE